MIKANEAKERALNKRNDNFELGKQLAKTNYVHGKILSAVNSGSLVTEIKLVNDDVKPLIWDELLYIRKNICRGFVEGLEQYGYSVKFVGRFSSDLSVKISWK